MEDGNHGEYRPRPDEFSSDGVSFIRAADMADGRVLFSSASCIDRAAYGRIRKGFGKPGDVLLSHKGTVGKVALVPAECPTFICSPQTTFWRVTDEKRLDRRFLFAYLQSHEFKNQLASRKGETDMADYVSLTAQRQLTIPVPPLPVQRAIGMCLAALNDRIDLLHETNTTLEAIAQALFKSWFVDFDPVRAKQQGLAPAGMDEATAALFPDRIEASSSGELPTGWRLASIYEVATIIYGAPFASAKFNTDRVGLPLVRIRDLRDESPGVWTPEVHAKGYLVQPGDIVVGMDGEFRAYLWGGEHAWLNQRVCVFAPKAGVPAAYVRLSVAPCLVSVESSETATTVIHLGKNDIDRFTVVVPDQAVLTAFGCLTDGLYARVIANKQMARCLSHLRDALLPRLVSGRLRLPSLEMTVT